MGLILDSTVLIAGERRGLTAVEVLREISEVSGGQHNEFAISAISVAELAHGAARARTEAIRTMRDAFLVDLLAFAPVFPVTVTIALSAGRLEGALAAQGLRVGLPDLLIGMTARELNYGVATANVRHFGYIPDLQILPLSL
jgi:predicted nucleic acid-binding protein